MAYRKQAAVMAILLHGCQGPASEQLNFTAGVRGKPHNLPHELLSFKAVI